ncbi:SigE family RNA polymerase sigma factor [soil metagenome]
MPQWGAGAQYTRLIEQHGGALLHLAILLTGNRHDAEDIVQDAVLSVALAWPTARPRSGFAYLKRAVTNRSIDVLRARREYPTDTVPEIAAEDFGFLRHEEDRQFFAMVDTLPLRQRATLVLRYFADMDDRAIGAALGCSVETVRAQAHHAITKLRAQEDLIGGKNR